MKSTYQVSPINKQNPRKLHMYSNAQIDNSFNLEF